MVTPSLGSVTAFVGIIAAVSLAIALAAFFAFRPNGARAATRTALGLGAVLLVSGGLARSGALLELHGSPLLLVYFAGSIGVMIAAALSNFGARIAERTPLALLVGFHVFRLPLEFVLHRWYLEGVIPVQMTYEGHNFDIVSGVCAIVFALGIALGVVGRRAAWLFSAIGIGLLLAVSMIAILSSPVPVRAYDVEPVLELAFHFPTTWIVPMGLGAAWFGHIVLVRKLRHS